MDIARLILEYLKAVLAGPVVAGIVAIVFFARFRGPISGLISRIATIKIPGGAELFMPQPPPEPPKTGDDLPAPSDQVPLLPAALSEDQLTAVRELFDAERARAYLWEYRYLNHFLVPQTKGILTWFNTLPQRVSTSMYDRCGALLSRTYSNARPFSAYLNRTT